VTQAEGSAGGAIEVRDAVKHYGDVAALDGISVSVRPGEFLTLLGPSGSGKTTTLNAIAGFVDLTSGDILLDGEPIAPIPTHRRNIGVIFQNYALFPHLRAAANVAYPLKQRKVPRAERERRVEETLELVGLQGVGRRYPRELSGGQQQRVAFARAIVFNPRVLLMDEPLGALDRKLRESLQRQIKSIHRDLGITFVYVTHDQEEALALSDRIAVFRDGRIEQVGSPAELYERPRSRFVAEFMGESTVLPGRFEDGAGAFRAAALEHPVRVAGDAPSRECCLVLRPQKLTLAATATRGRHDNEVPGVVADVSYLGASRRVSVDCGGTQFFVREDTHRTAPVEVGDEVLVTWDAGAGLLVPETSPGGAPDAASENAFAPDAVVLSNNPTNGS
jgi:putative spermidine/putrescine transport system ATP-binding protein